MKVEVIKVFFDDNGLHKIGEIVDVEKIDENLVKPVKETEKNTKKVTDKKRDIEV